MIKTKDKTFGHKTGLDLYNQKIVRVSSHSLDSLNLRLGSDSLSTIISIINKLNKANVVFKAQFKGFSTLSYTLGEANDPDAYKIPVGFIWEKGTQRIIRIITVIFRNAPTKNMSSKLSHDDETSKRMELFKQKLIEQANNKNQDHI